MSFLHFEKKKMALSIANSFQNIHFLPHFHYFYQWVRLVIFQINTDFLINQLQKYFYAIILQNTLHCSFIPTKRLCSRSQGFRQIDFLLHFCLISERMRCAIFQINADLVKVNEHINTFTQETLQLSFICEILSKNISLFSPKPIGVLCHRGFWKHPRFTICLLVLIVGKLYNISNKNQLPNRSAKYLLFYTKCLTYLLHFQGKLALFIGEAPGNIHFLRLFHWF